MKYKEFDLKLHQLGFEQAPLVESWQWWSGHKRSDEDFYHLQVYATDYNEYAVKETRHYLKQKVLAMFPFDQKEECYCYVSALIRLNAAL